MLMYLCSSFNCLLGFSTHLILPSITAGDTRCAANVIMLNRVLEMLSDLKEAVADDIWTAQLSPEPLRAAGA